MPHLSVTSQCLTSIHSLTHHSHATSFCLTSTPDLTHTSSRAHPIPLFPMLSRNLPSVYPSCGWAGYESTQLLTTMYSLLFGGLLLMSSSAHCLQGLQVGLMSTFTCAGHPSDFVLLYFPAGPHSTPMCLRWMSWLSDYAIYKSSSVFILSILLQQSY